MLTDVSGRLGTLLSKIVQLEVAFAAASETAVAAAQRNAGAGAADGPGEGSLLGSSSSLAATEASEAAVGSTSGRCSSKKLQWADGQAPAADGNGTPQMEGSADSGAVQHAGSGSSCDGEGDTSVAAADGEKALRKGFRRRTWAGPAWLGAVRSGKVRRSPGGAPEGKTNCCRSPGISRSPNWVWVCTNNSGGHGWAACILRPSFQADYARQPPPPQPLAASLLRKPPSGRGRGTLGTGAATLQRIVGYVEDPGSSEDEAVAGGRDSNPFDLGSSEDELDGEGGAVVDR